jgi:hypothetical protein
MGLNETTKQLREVLSAISVDLEKGSTGNKAASQRVRTGTIKLEKIAKNYRKESINAEKSGTGPKKASKQKASKNQQSKAKAPAKTMKTAAKQAVKSKPKAKAVVNTKSQKPANKAHSKKA